MNRTGVMPVKWADVKVKGKIIGRVKLFGFPQGNNIWQWKYIPGESKFNPTAGEYVICLTIEKAEDEGPIKIS